MSSAGDDPRDDRLADLLATYDDALAKGQISPSTLGSDADLHRRASEARATLRQLETIWPRADLGSPTGDGIELPPASARLGRFLILEELGRGGFGVVFRAVDPALGRDVALKVPRPETLITPELRLRFLGEARAAARLDHPNIVPVYEAGEIGSISYIASAYCEGTTLAVWLKDRPEPVPARLAARLIAVLARAVQHAHDRGILHRDLKPSNILLQSSAEGRPDSGEDLSFVPRVTDFGLAKILDEAGSETRTGLPIGSPSYMAPEQAEGRSSAMGPWTDVYALGSILYELLTGQPPFRGNSVLETLERVRSVEPEPPSRLRPKLPRDLETICLMCLRKEAVARYAAADDLAEDLARFVSGRPILARPAGPLARAWNWALRPERVRDAGVLAMVVASLAMIWPIYTIIFVQLGIVLPPHRPREFYQQVLALIFIDLGPSLWLGWQMAQGRRWAIWAAGFVAIVHLLVQFGCLLGMPPYYGGFYDDRSMRIPYYSILITFGTLNVIFNLFALLASDAIRSKNERQSSAFGR